MKKVLIVPTSIRTPRAADGVLTQVKSALGGYGTIDASVFDFKDTPLPFFDGAMPPSADGFEPSDDNAKTWIDAVRSADTILLLVAEYNHSYTAILKNAIDWLPPTVLEGKPVSFIGYGFSGGSRAIEKTRALLTGFIQATPSTVEGQLFLTKTINFDGSAIDEAAAKAEIDKVLDDIVSA